MRTPSRRVLLALATGIGVAVVGTSIGGLVWLHDYAPLTYQGGSWSAGYQLHGVAASVDPQAAIDSRTIVFPRFRQGRDFFVGFTLWNTGRLDLTLLGVDTSRFPRGWQGMYPRDVRAAAEEPSLPFESGVLLGKSVPTSHLRIRAHRERFVWIGFRMSSCRGLPKGATQTFSDVPLRYRYLGHFIRTQTIALPFNVTLACHGPFPRSTRTILAPDGHPSRSRAARAAAERADARPARPRPRLRRTRLSF
jgi:hypothetical protein